MPRMAERGMAMQLNCHGRAILCSTLPSSCNAFDEGAMYPQAAFAMAGLQADDDHNY